MHEGNFNRSPSAQYGRDRGVRGEGIARGKNLTVTGKVLGHLIWVDSFTLGKESDGAPHVCVLGPIYHFCA